MDQLFSKVSTFLRKNGAETQTGNTKLHDNIFSCKSCKNTTYTELTRAIEESYTPTPEVKVLECVHDVKEWLSPHLHDVHGHTEPLHFKFIKDDGHTVMMYKPWCTDPCAGRTCEIRGRRLEFCGLRCYVNN